jgi:hypothetical protein
MGDNILCDHCLYRCIEHDIEHGKMVEIKHCEYSVTNFPHMRHCMRYAPEHYRDTD